MRVLILIILFISIINATSIHRPILLIQEEPHIGIIKQDEVYAIDFGTQFECQDSIKEQFQQTNAEIIEQGLSDCANVPSVTENREERQIEVDKAKICLKNKFQKNSPKEYEALVFYVDCIVNDTIKKYKIDRFAQTEETESNPDQKQKNKNVKKGFQQIQDECSKKNIIYDDEKINSFFDELNSKCREQKSNVYIRMRVLEECSKEFDVLLKCVQDIKTDNNEGKQSILDYISCQRDIYISNPKVQVIDYLL